MDSGIIEITEEDIAVSAEIIRRSFKTVADEFGLTKENCPTNGAFLDVNKLLDDCRRGIKMYGILGKGRQVGFIALERKDKDTFYIEKLAVLPEFRHNGYKAILMDYAKEYVRQAGGTNMSIGIICENKRLLNWYKAYGFTET